MAGTTDSLRRWPRRRKTAPNLARGRGRCWWWARAVGEAVIGRLVQRRFGCAPSSNGAPLAQSGWLRFDCSAREAAPVVSETGVSEFAGQFPIVFDTTAGLCERLLALAQPFPIQASPCRACRSASDQRKQPSRPPPQCLRRDLLRQLPAAARVEPGENLGRSHGLGPVDLEAARSRCAGAQPRSAGPLQAAYHLGTRSRCGWSWQEGQLRLASGTSVLVKSCCTSGDLGRREGSPHVSAPEIRRLCSAQPAIPISHSHSQLKAWRPASASLLAAGSPALPVGRAFRLFPRAGEVLVCKPPNGIHQTAGDLRSWWQGPTLDGVRFAIEAGGPGLVCRWPCVDWRDGKAVFEQEFGCSGAEAQAEGSSISIGGCWPCAKRRSCGPSSGRWGRSLCSWSLKLGWPLPAHPPTARRRRLGLGCLVLEAGPAELLAGPNLTAGWPNQVSAACAP